MAATPSGQTRKTPGQLKLPRRFLMDEPLKAEVHLVRLKDANTAWPCRKTSKIAAGKSLRM
jgi:hypothetical protein